MSKRISIPSDFPVQPLKPGVTSKRMATCGHGGLSWDDGKITGMTPAPSGRCPFEAFHVYVADEPDESRYAYGCESTAVTEAADELLAALRDVQGYFDELVDMQPNRNRGTEFQRIREVVQDAIAKADS